MSADTIELLSEALADRVAAAAPAWWPSAPAIGNVSGILWRPDLVVTSEQLLGERTEFNVAHGGTTVSARLIGRDPGTNVALLRLEATLLGVLPEAAPLPRVGSLALVLGADATGAPTGRLAMLHAVGPEWHSQAGGRIDALLRLDVRLGADEGGPVLTPGGKLLGMSTSGPPRRIAGHSGGDDRAGASGAAGRRPCRPRLAGRRPAARRGAGTSAHGGRQQDRHDRGQPGGWRAGRAGWGAARRHSSWMSMARRYGTLVPWRRCWGRNGSARRCRCVCCGLASCAH